MSWRAAGASVRCFSCAFRSPRAVVACSFFAISNRRAMGKQIQVVDAAGGYQEAAVLDFVRGRGIADAGVKYSTVAIMGPQSSGKSTLLNVVVRACLKSQPVWDSALLDGQAPSKLANPTRRSGSRGSPVMAPSSASGRLDRVK